MTLSRRGLIGAAAALPLAGAMAGRARAQAAAGKLRIGVLNDQSGTYRDGSGPTSVACARQAIEDFNASGKHLDVEVLVGDHQNKPDIGAGIARQWIDRDGVSLILDVPTSSVALAVGTIAAEKNVAYVNSGAGTTDLTGRACNANTIHWGYDTYMLAKSSGGATVKEGGTTWFLITADYVFGQQLQRDTTHFVEAAGGKVLGHVSYPFPSTSDFSSFLLQAQASGAKVVGFCNAGDDTINCIKQAHEFGVAGKAQLVGLLTFIQTVKALGPMGVGLLLTESFYWNMNDRTRAFMARLRPKTPDNYPNCEQAGVYAGALHYFKALDDLGGIAHAKDGSAVVSRMKAMPADDDAFGKITIREDGRALTPAFLFRGKAMAARKGPWDLYDLVATTSGEEAAPPLAQEGCKLVKS